MANIKCTNVYIFSQNKIDDPREKYEYTKQNIEFCSKRHSADD